MESTQLARLRRVAGRQTTKLTHYGRKTGKPHEVTIWLTLSFAQSEHRILRSATDSEILPEPEPRTFGMHFIMPSIRGRDIACAEWPDIWRFEHFLNLLNFVNNAFNVHSPTV